MPHTKQHQSMPRAKSLSHLGSKRRSRRSKGRKTRSANVEIIGNLLERREGRLEKLAKSDAVKNFLVEAELLKNKSNYSQRDRARFFIHPSKRASMPGEGPLPPFVSQDAKEREQRNLERLKTVEGRKSLLRTYKEKYLKLLGIILKNEESGRSKTGGSRRRKRKQSKWNLKKSRKR